MRIENNTVKYNQNSTFLIDKKQANAIDSGVHHQSFKGLGNGVISVMDAVDRGGLFASFVIQDFLGMNLPRTWVGLQRNKDITGENNYQEAAEVAIREFLSGPVMFTVPMLMLWGIKRSFGKANDVSVNVIKTLGDKFTQSVEGKQAAELTDMAKVKKDFYKTLFKDILTNAGLDDKEIESKSVELADDILSYEKLVDDKKTTKFIDKLLGKKVEGTAETKLSSIIEKYSDLVKQNASSPSKNFLAVNLSTNENSFSKSINKFIVDMRNFTEDAVETFSKKLNKGAINGEDFKSFFNNFTNMRAGSRVLTNISMLVGTIGFCSIIPKLYQLSDKNPALIGLEGDEANNSQNKLNDKTELNNEQKTNVQKTVAFSGAIDSLGKVVAKKDGKLSKFFNEFEFDSYNLSFMGFLTACGIGVLLPRLYHAREENEYKEILFRDTVTIGAIACLAKCVQQMFARMCTKVTGFALAIKPEFKQPTKMKEYLAYLRPVKGHSVLNSEQLQSKYTNLEKYNEKIAGFAKFIDEQGGDIRKMFSVDKDAFDLLKNIYSASDKASLIGFEKADNKQIIEALSEVVETGKAKDSLDKLYAIFRNNDNAFLRKAKIMNSSFNFAILFLIAPVVFGWFIPKLNEALTKKRQFEKHEQNKGVNEPKLEKAQVNEAKDTEKFSTIQTMAAKNIKKSVAFKEFIGA